MNSLSQSKKFLLSGGVLLCSLSFAGSAFAADWNGAYWGGSLGYGWGSADTKFYPLPTPAAFVNLAPQTLTPNPKGALLGAQIGYNWQSGKRVAGIEADLSWSGMSDRKSRSPFIQNTGASFNGTLTAKQELDWFGTLRGRLGFVAADNWLIYGTGGLAWGHVKNSANADFRPGGTITYPASESGTKTGWTLGVGAEWAMSPRSFVKFEYLYYDLGGASDTANPVPANPPFQVKYKWDTTGNILRVGLNYKF